MAMIVLENAMAVVALWLVLAAAVAEAVKMEEIRRLVTENKTSCLLVFGDSSVDPGNNNRLRTSVKSNFPPYGKDFINGQATGRFCDGRLVTDFIAEAQGRGRLLTGFLDPKLREEDLLTGVSFASAGSGYDDLTANLSSVLTISRQLEYFKHYKLHLGQLMGVAKAEDYVRKATFLLSLGSNDFLQNYFLEPTRRKQFSLRSYQQLLVSFMRTYVQEMQKLGARRVLLVGVPNIGCMPISRTLAGDNSHCVQTLNNAASALNSMLEKELSTLQAELNIKAIFVDAFKTIEKAINNPKKHGFTEIAKGCCGTGSFEYGDTCRGLSTCEDPRKYVFWDAVHPSERMYHILFLEVLASLDYDFFL